MKSKKISDAKIATFESTEPILVGLYAEIKALAMKKPEATLSKTKVSLVNRLLTDVKSILQDEDYGKYLDILEDENLPQYSDVLLIMSQYNAALKSFRENYHYYDASDGGSGWHHTKKR